MTESCLVCAGGTIPGPTGICDKCGSRYVRGVLVQEGTVRKPVPIRHRAAQPKQDRVNFDSLPFHHYSNARTRLDAINEMYDSYDRYPGRRRRPAREAFEVLQAVNEAEGGVWILTVRRTGS